MDGRKKAADPEFTTEPSWKIGGEDAENVNHGYLFGSNNEFRDTSVLSDFGWNIPAESNGVCGCDGGFLDFDRIGSDLAGSSADGYISNVDISASAPPQQGRDITTIGGTQPMVLAEEKYSPFASNPSVSSSSSEDLAEKSTASGGSTSTAAANPTPSSDTANILSECPYSFLGKTGARLKRKGKSKFDSHVLHL